MLLTLPDETSPLGHIKQLAKVDAHTRAHTYAHTLPQPGKRQDFVENCRLKEKKEVDQEEEYAEMRDVASLGYI